MPFGQQGLYGAALDDAVLEGRDRLRDYTRRFQFHRRVADYAIGFSNLMTSSSGRCYFRERKIILSGLFHAKYGWDEMDQTLRHEMVHATLFEERKPHHHASHYFRDYARRVGARTWHSMALEPNFIYECPACGRFVKRVRPLRPDTACGVHAGWAEEYVLVLKFHRSPGSLVPEELLTTGEVGRAFVEA